MQLPITNKTRFPSEVLDLLRALHSVDFFQDSMLIGSWVMLLYQDVFGIDYVLRTQDIDFAVKFACSDRTTTG
ncbi:MAG: GSU2403 family nucleotidyltransferase fold protein [Pseudomonadota bacterium]